MREKQRSSQEAFSSSPPNEEGYELDAHIGKARKRAIAVLIVLTNLVPVRLSILLPSLH